MVSLIKKYLHDFSLLLETEMVHDLLTVPTQMTATGWCSLEILRVP